MVKRFSTVRDTQRGSQSYMKKRRGRREIELTRRRRSGVKRGESSLGSNQFPICSPQSGTLREVHGVPQRREEEEGDRGDQNEKRGSQNGREQSSQQSQLSVNMDTEDQILKGTELILKNTKKQRLKIQSRGQTQKYNVKNIKQNESQKL